MSQGFGLGDLRRWCNKEWQVDRFYATEPLGVQTYPVYLNFDEPGTTASVGFSDSPQDAANELREVRQVLLLKSSNKQWD